MQVCARSKLKQFLFSPPETLLTPAFVGWRVAFGITLRFASPSAMPAGLVFHLLKKAPSVMHAAPCPHPVHSATANRAALPPVLLPQASRDREEERGSHEGAMGCPACGHSGTLSRHARRDSWWRDVPHEGQPRVRRGQIVRWRCPGCRHTHARLPEWADPARRATRALVAWVRQEAAQGRGVAQLARLCGMDEKTVRMMLAGAAVQRE